MSNFRICHRLADITTFSRIFGSCFLPFIKSSAAAFCFTGILLLTDGIDGLFASRWPDPKRACRWYHRLPIIFDCIADTALFISCLAWVLIYQAWTWVDLVIFGVSIILFIVTRSLQDSPKTGEPVTTVAATVSMWLFGFGIIWMMVIMLRNSKNWFSLAIISSIIGLLTLIIRGKRIINTPDKRT